MAVTASTVDTASMRADLPGLRRFLTAAVTSLLVADLAAVGVVVAARRDSTPRPAAAAASPTRTVAVITTPDGQRLLADPTTARGQLAIRDAIEHGGSVSNITVPDIADNGQAPGLQTPFAIPHADDVLTVPLGSTLDRTIDSVLASAPIGPGAGGGTTTLPGSPLTSLLNDTQSTLLNTVTTVQNTVSTLLNTVTTLPSTVTSLGNTASTTVGTTVTSLQGTVTTLQGTVTTLQSTVTTAPSLLGGTVSTLTSTVSSVVTTAPLSTTQPVSTTLPPSPPTTTTICTLLVHC